MSKLLAAIRLRAESAGKLPALTGDNQQLRYLDLMTAVDDLVSNLRYRRIKRLALLADNSPFWVVVDLACLDAGVTLIPIPVFHDVKQIANILSQCSADALISDRALDDKELTGFLASGEKVQRLNGITSLALWLLPIPLAPVPLPPTTAKISYTSGVTGPAKGVCLSLFNQYATASAVNSALSKLSLSRHLAALPLSSLFENIAGVHAALLRGAEVLVPSLQSLAWLGSEEIDIAALCASFSRLQPDSAVINPRLLKEMLAACQQEGWQPPASLGFMVVTGDRVASELIESARNLGLPVYQAYGLAECGSVVAMNTPDVDQPGSAGKVLAHCKVQLVEGEIQLKKSVHLAYLPGVLLTAEAELESKKKAVVASGDLGSIDEKGFLWVQGRSGNQLTSSYGELISPEWPESELLVHPGIVQCMVIGHAKAYCAALIYVDPGCSLVEIGRHIRQCNKRLPDNAQLRRWAAIPKPLSAENGLLTKEGQMQREAVARFYSEIVAECYPGIVYPLREPTPKADMDDNSDFVENSKPRVY